MWASVLVVVGLVALVAGGELLVRGASALALRARISPTVVGLTVVAAGTSMPELVVSTSAAAAGSPDLAMGNVVGSNIANIALILGVASVIRPLGVSGDTVRLQWPVMLLAACLLHLLARDGLVDRLEGGFFALGLVWFVAWTVRLARRVVSDQEREVFERALPARSERVRILVGALARTGAGIGLLVLGARALVDGAVVLATVAGLSERVIGLTVVAVGTSLPELATSAVAACRGETDIAVANVVGSNVFNVLGILGLTAIVAPVPVTSGTLSWDDPWMVGLSLVLLPLMWTGARVVRWEGILLLALYAGYVTSLVVR